MTIDPKPCKRHTWLGNKCVRCGAIAIPASEALTTDPTLTWRAPRDVTPPVGRQVLCAWICAWTRGENWHYRVAKFTGKRWLDVLPESPNEEYIEPDYWKYIEAPT